MKLGHEMLKYRDEIIHHIVELVRIRSVREVGSPGMPYGEGIDRALQYMLALGESMGFRTANIDGYAGHVEFGEGDELIAMLVHLDTVHEGEGWMHPPFGGEIHNGCIFGRGASDNKGPAVVALYVLKAIRDLGIPLHKKIRVIFGTNEENDMTDMDYYFAREPLPDMAFMPDACYPIFNAEMGNVNILLSQTLGPEDSPGQLRIGHLSGGSTLVLVPESCTVSIPADSLADGDMERLIAINPNVMTEPLTGGFTKVTVDGTAQEPPSNAAMDMIQWLRGFSRQTKADRLLAFLHELIGRETNGESLGVRLSDDISGSTLVFLRQVMTVGDKLSALVGVRYPVSYNGDWVLSIIEEYARNYGVQMELVRHFRPVYFPPGHPLIRKLSLAYEKMTGEEAVLLQMAASTYARKLQNRGVAFGAAPRDGVYTYVHRADEFVPIDDMMRHAEISLQGLYELSV